MSIVKDEIEEKNQEIERLRATIVEKGKQQESTWATGSLLLQIRYKFIPYKLYRIFSRTTSSRNRNTSGTN